MIDWAVARRVGQLALGDEPAPQLVPGDLIALSEDAERRVVAYTGLEPTAPLPRTFPRESLRISMPESEWMFWAFLFPGIWGAASCWEATSSECPEMPARLRSFCTLASRDP